VAISLFPVVVRRYSHLLTLSASSPWSKTPGLPSELYRNCSDICHTVWDINTSGSDGHIAISGCPPMSHLFVDTFFEFGVVENFVYRARITVILTSDLFGCMSLWLWLCPLLLLPVLSVIFKMYKYRSLYSSPVILPFSVSNIQKNVTSVKFISLHHRRTMLVVAKRVTWTLHPNRPRKTGSRYNDILSCDGKHKWSDTMSQK